MNLNTSYLGISVKSPVIVGSCGLTTSVENIRAMAQSGAGAVVLKSVFEEEILLDFEKNVMSNIGPMDNDLEFFDYYDYQIKNEVLEKYHQLILNAKKEVDIPIVASINCLTSGNWLSYAKKLEEAGADGLELNILKLPFDHVRSSAEIEHLYIDIIEKVRERISIPLAVKIGPYFSNLGEFVKRLSLTGVNGIVLFNKYFSFDINIKSEEVVSGNIFSSPSDYVLPLRWVSILSEKVQCDLIASTGILSAESAIKMILAGAGSVQVASALYKNGIDFIGKLNAGISEWMESKGYTSIADFKGNLGQTASDKPDIYERVQFMKYYSDQTPSEL